MIYDKKAKLSRLNDDLNKSQQLTSNMLPDDSFYHRKSHKDSATVKLDKPVLLTNKGNWKINKDLQKQISFSCKCKEIQDKRSNDVHSEFNFGLDNVDESTISDIRKMNLLRKSHNELKCENNAMCNNISMSFLESKKVLKKKKSFKIKSFDFKIIQTKAQFNNAIKLSKCKQVELNFNNESKNAGMFKDFLIEKTVNDEIICPVKKNSNEQHNLQILCKEENNNNKRDSCNSKKNRTEGFYANNPTENNQNLIQISKISLSSYLMKKNLINNNNNNNNNNSNFAIKNNLKMTNLIKPQQKTEKSTYHGPEELHLSAVKLVHQSKKIIEIRETSPSCIPSTANTTLLHLED